MIAVLSKNPVQFQNFIESKKSSGVNTDKFIIGTIEEIEGKEIEDFEILEGAQYGSDFVQNYKACKMARDKFLFPNQQPTE